ncbi:hypothetical protein CHINAEXTREME_08385 [Halobiforma lacisalsi AJ5]|uniref:Uncharacterized protein n=1 Tax=Natronobacterium lacisalsi AJ5 TaxID=358396 RepID=M0LWD1_NATLA|nr:hypothetical protein [Halobiforma lacisalsi]APW97795.1 hypothetical protein CHINAEXTREME_08385 [Halobiforma lacisalsi AJ5]EMA37458.1 hypothetical protein C445_01186 [Halobiforma lacisalsi AJ5]
MSSEQRTFGRRVLDAIERVHQRYNRAAGTVGAYTPRVVKAAEAILAVALFAMTAYWFVLYL